MRKCLLVLFLFSILFSAASPALAQKPLTQDEATSLITSKLPRKQVIKTLQERGIGFLVTRQYIEDLQNKGAKQNVLAALCLAATDPLTIDQLLVLVKSGMTDNSLAALVERRHLSFKPSDDDLDELRGLGGGDRLEKALLTSKIVSQTVADGKVAPAFGGAPQPGTLQDAAGNKITPPRLISQTTPHYTSEARQAKISGIVYLKIVVSEKGEVTDAKVTKGLGYGLDENAVKAVKSWKFEPARRNGAPVATAVMVEVKFVYDAEHYPGLP